MNNQRNLKKEISKYRKWVLVGWGGKRMGDQYFYFCAPIGEKSVMHEHIPRCPPPYSDTSTICVCVCVCAGVGWGWGWGWGGGSSPGFIYLQIGNISLNICISNESMNDDPIINRVPTKFATNELYQGITLFQKCFS